MFFTKAERRRLLDRPWPGLPCPLLSQAKTEDSGERITSANFAREREDRFKLSA